MVSEKKRVVSNTKSKLNKVYFIGLMYKWSAFTFFGCSISIRTF